MHYSAHRSHSELRLANWRDKILIASFHAQSDGRTAHHDAASIFPIHGSNLGAGVVRRFTPKFYMVDTFHTRIHLLRCKAERWCSGQGLTWTMNGMSTLVIRGLQFTATSRCLEMARSTDGGTSFAAVGKGTVNNQLAGVSIAPGESVFKQQS